jgi:hypothetical protein
MRKYTQAQGRSLEIDFLDFMVIAANGAAAVLMDVGIIPEVICTDLD